MHIQKAYIRYKGMLVYKGIKKRAYIEYALNNEESSYYEKRLFAKLKTKKINF